MIRFQISDAIGNLKADLSVDAGDVLRIFAPQGARAAAVASGASAFADAIEAEFHLVLGNESAPADVVPGLLTMKTPMADVVAPEPDHGATALPGAVVEEPPAE